MFSFNVSNKNNNTHIKIDGELTIYSASQLFNEYVKPLQTGDSLSFDLSEVEELDTAGAQILLFLFAEAQRNNKPCQMLAQSEAVRRYVHLFNLESHFALVTDGGERAK